MSSRLQKLCTEKVLKAIAFAQEEPGHVICGENLLIGLMAVESGIAAKTLKYMKLKLPVVRKLVTNLHKDAPPQENVEDILDRAYKESGALEHTYIGTEHLLLALLSDTTTVVILQKLSVEPKLIRSHMLRLLGYPSGT